MRINPVKPFIVILLFLLLAACGSKQKYEPIAKGAAVLAFGDSVTYGTGARPGEDYATRLAEISGWKIANAGIPGDTATAARSRIETLLQQTRPALVIVELGGNDFLRQRAEQDVKEDLRAILVAVKKSGATPVLVAVPAFSPIRAGIGNLADAAIYAALAKEEKVFLIDGVMSKILSDPSLRSDQIHPNGEGYQAFADGIANALARAGLLLKTR